MPRPTDAPSRQLGGGEARLRAGLQPPGPLAVCAPRRTGLGRRHALAVPVLRRAATQPVLPEDDAQGAYRTARPCRRHELLRGIVTAQAAELPLWQRILPGTTPWRISMGRRQVVESVNAAPKGAFVDLARGFLRVMGLTKATVLLGFTLAAFNLNRIRSYRSKHRIQADEEP
jgi:hypothetical protein